MMFRYFMCAKILWKQPVICSLKLSGRKHAAVSADGLRVERNLPAERITFTSCRVANASEPHNFDRLVSG